MSRRRRKAWLFRGGPEAGVQASWRARVGDDVLLVLDEFSAVQGGTDQAIHLAERLRDVGVPVVFGAQSPEGLWTCPGFPDVSYLLGSLLPAAMVSFASYSSGLR